MKLAIIALLATSASAEPWRATEGSLEAGLAPESYILSTNAAPGRYSEGTAIAPVEVDLPYRFDLHLRRLGPEAGRSMHVLVAGGIILIKENAISFYAYDDAAFASGEWKHLEGYRAHDDHAIRVDQDANRVTVTIDNRAPVVFPLAVARKKARVGVGMKGAPGYRSQIAVHDLVVKHSGT
ncbi:MAG: hypothetical protein QM831_14825 [Kofleriaceae bacterium]